MRTFAFVTVAVVAATFTGCGSTEDSVTTTTAQPTSTTTTTKGSTSKKTTTTTLTPTTTTEAASSTKFMSTTTTTTTVDPSSSTVAPSTTYCQFGDDFCRSQTVNGGDFSGSHCKYYMDKIGSFCQAPVESTDEAQKLIRCSCDAPSTTVTVTTKAPVTTTTTTKAPETPKKVTTTTTKAPETPKKVTTTTTNAPETTTTSTTTTTEAPVPRPSGKFCGSVEVPFMGEVQGSVTVAADTFTMAVPSLEITLADIGFTLADDGKFNIDFTSPSMVKVLAGFKITPEDAPKKIKASYNAVDDSITVGLPLVGDLVVSKGVC